MNRYNTTQVQYYPLGGGLDIVTPALSIDPGRALALVNFEPWFDGGYRRIDGYERFDGRPQPHQQTFLGVEVATTAGLAIGDTFTGDTSGATGTVVDLQGRSLALTHVTGRFTLGETANNNAVRLTRVPAMGYAPSDDLRQRFLTAAQNRYRADIGEVPGRGPVLGVWQRRSTVYAISIDPEGNQGILYYASGNGWTTVGITYARTLFFNEGSDDARSAWIQPGDTLIGATSGATATVHRVILHTGSAGNDDAEGYLALTNVTGAFGVENLTVGGATVGRVAVATAGRSDQPFALAPGGVYQFINHNFFGGTDTYRTYAVNGLGNAFEIDENHVVTPILMRVTSELDPRAFPFLIEEHRNHLFLAFPGGSLLQSVIGEPLNFNAVLGAAEFGMGDEITGLQSVVGGVLVITTARETRGLFGANITDWDLRLIGEQTGGVRYSTQKLDTVYALDDLGITSIARTDAFGDFAGATVSQLVQPLIQALRDRVTSSTIVRESNQYRVYFDNRSCLVMYVPTPGNVNRERASTDTEQGVQFSLLAYDREIHLAVNSEDERGRETSYFTSTSGFVYRDRVGHSFDGAPIRAYARLAFNQVGSPSTRKRFRRINLDINATETPDIRFTADLSLGLDDVAPDQADVSTLTLNDTESDPWANASWQAFDWDAYRPSVGRANLTGSGEAIGLVLFNESAEVAPFVLQGITLHYDRRRLQR